MPPPSRPAPSSCRASGPSAITNSISGCAHSAELKSPRSQAAIDRAHELHVLLRHRLLRQPRGFEGFVHRREDADPHDHARRGPCRARVPLACTSIPSRPRKRLVNDDHVLARVVEVSSASTLNVSKASSRTPPRRPSHPVEAAIDASVEPIAARPCRARSLAQSAERSVERRPG